MCGQDVEAGATEANRLPQFNESYCRYRCGWGCCEPRNGGDSVSETTTTFVESEGEHRSTTALVLPQRDLGGSRVEGSSSRDVAGTSDHGDGYEGNRILVAREGSYVPQLSQYYSGSPESQDDRSTSGSRSVAVPESGSLGTVSPGALVVGAGTWDIDNEADRFPPQYHFIVTPLRLSPQYEHCRGHPVSHMVTRDDMVLLDYIEEGWRRQALGVDRFLWHDESFSSR
jgi:hypothetical protein